MSRIIVRCGVVFLALALVAAAQEPGDEEQRALLVAVPYALKAADAETLGGKPLSAFVLTESAKAGESKAGVAVIGTTAAASTDHPDRVAVTAGTAGRIGKFTNSTELRGSVLFAS